jgi:hypothetical protein
MKSGAILSAGNWWGSEMDEKDIKALNDFVDESIRRSNEKGYYPSVFIEMRKNHGTVIATKRLVETSEIQSGFVRLKQLDLLDWSLEAAVIKFPILFDTMTREYAGFRLSQAKGRKLKRDI